MRKILEVIENIEVREDACDYEDEDEDEEE